MIALSGLTKKFRNSKIEIFSNTNFEMTNQNSIAIRGRSGSGKSTLLNIIAGIDMEYSGQYFYRNDLLIKKDHIMAAHRLKNIGIITQNYDLLTDRDVFNNIAFPLRCQNIKEREVKDIVNSTMDLLNLNELKKSYPRQLSGGQCQRVALARALVKKTELILADEPTGALDEYSEREILDTLAFLIKRGQKMIIATHSQVVASY